MNENENYENNNNFSLKTSLIKNTEGEIIKNLIKLDSDILMNKLNENSELTKEQIEEMRKK